MEHQTLYYGDCLDWMQEWPTSCVDLIYLDPPFNSNTNYNILFGRGNGRPAQVRAFGDTWRWDDAAASRLERIRNAVSHPAHKAVSGFEMQIGESGMLAYLTYMAERVAEMKRLLKPTGNVFLHCDDTASHYLRILMDGIFGAANYRNHITWRRSVAHNDPRRFGRIADHILFYAASDEFYWNGDAARVPKTSDEMRALYPSTDDRGRYRNADLTGPAHGAERGSPSTQPWSGYDVFAMGRVWSAPLTGRYAEYIERNFIPGYRDIQDIHERLDALDKAGLIRHPEEGGRWPGLKRYADADTGNPPQNIILEPRGFTNFSARRGEYLGYPTQKPVGLLEKLIPAACPEGGLVLDPFCGCGTTIIAAQNLGRLWAGVDISASAIDIIQERRLGAIGIKAETRGIPADMESARRLASDKPLDFEAWAVTRIPGLAPNEVRVGDGGIDGRGSLLTRPENRRQRLVLAQVKGGRFSLSQFRNFLHTIERDNAAMGIYITLDRVGSRTARSEAAGMGNIQVGASTYPRAQLWSIADYFNGRMPNLPAMSDPYTGRAIAIQQGLV